MSDRDDANLKHFRSRAQQTKVQPSSVPAEAPSPVNITLVFDSGFGSISDELEATKFRYMGVSPTMSQYNMSCARRQCQGAMKEFKY